MLNSHPHEFSIAAEAFLHVIKEDVCGPCLENNKNLAPVNLENVLECECRCEKIASLLETAKQYLSFAKE